MYKLSDMIQKAKNDVDTSIKLPENNMEEDTDTNETNDTSAIIIKSNSKDAEENDMEEELDVVNSQATDLLRAITRPDTGKNDETSDLEPCTAPNRRGGH